MWAEETLIEDNLVLDILFLAYYESFCTCDGGRWKKLCSLYKVYCNLYESTVFFIHFVILIRLEKKFLQGITSGDYNIGKLAISSEALQSSYHVKVQLLLILIETLDLETLLQMVHDEIPFRFFT